MLTFYLLILSMILFSTGLLCILIYKNLLFILIGIEVMTNAAMMSMVVAGSYWNNVEGSILYIISITISAVDTSICLALFMLLSKNKLSINIDKISDMKG